MKIRAQAILLSFVSLTLYGCNDRPRGTLSPVFTRVPGTSTVSMLVATTRRVAPGEMFSGERGNGLSFGEITISIPPDEAREIGEIQWPNPAKPDPLKEFVPLSAEVLSEDAAISRFNARTRRAAGHTLVFVHGYNMTLEEAVYRFAEVIHDSGASASPILFTWPSLGKAVEYDYDRDSVMYSRDDFESFLRMLAKDGAVSKISILSHSIGNTLTLETLRQLSIRNKNSFLKIQDVMLVDPEENFDVFRKQLKAIGAATTRFTLFLSEHSRTVPGSGNDNNRIRVSDIRPEQEPYRQVLEQNRLRVVDLTDIGTADKLGHAQFAEAPELVRTIGARLASGGKLSEERIMSTTIGSSLGYVMDNFQLVVAATWQFLKDNWIQIAGISAAAWALFKHFTDRRSAMATAQPQPSTILIPTQSNGKSGEKENLSTITTASQAASVNDTDNQKV